MNKVIFNDKLILDVWGGLGDNLQVTTIPRRFFEKFGYKGVYISNSVPWRNTEIKQVVWDRNPYIAGFTNEKGINISDNGLVKFDGTTNWIQNMEQIYGFESPWNTRPEIYADISDRDEHNVKNSIVIDMSYSEESYKRNLGMFPNMFETATQQLSNLLSQNNGTEIKVIYQPKHLNNVNFFEIVSNEYEHSILNVQSLLDYCNIIKHCKQYICSHSGNHALAAAIRKKCICFIQSQYFSMKYFVFDNVNYVTI